MPSTATPPANPSKTEESVIANLNLTVVVLMFALRVKCLVFLLYSNSVIVVSGFTPSLSYTLTQWSSIILYSNLTIAPDKTSFETSRSYSSMHPAAEITLKVYLLV